MSLLIIGTVAFDAIETPFGKTDKIVGGSATYVGYSAAKLGVNPKLVAVVGDDFPTETINDLKNAGFDLEGLQVKKEEKTFRRNKIKRKYSRSDNSQSKMKLPVGRSSCTFKILVFR